MPEKVKQNRLESLPISIEKIIRRVFPSFDQQKLKAADFKMWQAIRVGKATPGDYETYSRAVLKDEGYNTSTPSSSRLMFVDFLGDRMQEMLYGQKATDRKSVETKIKK